MPYTIFNAGCPFCSKVIKAEFTAHDKKNLPTDLAPVQMMCPHCRGVAHLRFNRGRVSSDPPTENMIRDDLRGVPLERRKHDPVDEPLKKDVVAVKKAMDADG